MDLIAWSAGNAALSAPRRAGLAAASRFHAEHHHLRVPTGYEDAYGYRLGTFIVGRRTARRQGVLIEDWIAELDALGMICDHEATWQGHLTTATESTPSTAISPSPCTTPADSSLSANEPSPATPRPLRPARRPRPPLDPPARPRLAPQIPPPAAPRRSRPQPLHAASRHGDRRGEGGKLAAPPVLRLGPARARTARPPGPPAADPDRHRPAPARQMSLGAVEHRVCAVHRHCVRVLASGAGLGAPAVTCRRRLCGSLLAELEAAGVLGRSRAVMPGLARRGAQGRPQTGSSPVGRARTDFRHQLIAEGHGIPLAVSLTGKNRMDVTSSSPCSRPSRRCAPVRGRPRRRPVALCAGLRLGPRRVPQAGAGLPDHPGHRAALESSTVLGWARTAGWDVGVSGVFVRQFRLRRVLDGVVLRVQEVCEGVVTCRCGSGRQVLRTVR